MACQPKFVGLAVTNCTNFSNLSQRSRNPQFNSRGQAEVFSSLLFSSLLASIFAALLLENLWHPGYAPCHPTSPTSNEREYWRRASRPPQKNKTKRAHCAHCFLTFRRLRKITLSAPIPNRADDHDIKSRLNHLQITQNTA